MRIEGPSALMQALLAAAPAASRAASVPFQPAPPPPPSMTAAPAMGAGPVASVAMLVTLAAAEPTADRRAEQMRSAAVGLDALAGLHRDLVAGPTVTQRLSGLREWARRRQRGADTELDALLDEVELRILVELARRGED
ncbi:flagellar assembly protein FliX [Sphingomonas sp.]|uniref:flagellar assembly protein FliX n=1 Tax=Sphingomonas sp. TaxID=28214 RepID=UPI0037518B82